MTDAERIVLLESTMEQMAADIHRDYHTLPVFKAAHWDWRTCSIGTCPYARRALAQSREEAPRE